MLILVANASGLYTTSTSLQAHASLATGVEQTIDYGNSTLVVSSDLTGNTVFDLLNQTAAVTFTEYAYGKFILSINGVENNANNNGYFWQYWVNDELAPVAADNYVLSDGDYVLWKYCAPENTTTPSPTVNPEFIMGLVIIGIVGVTVIIAASFVYIKMR